MVDAVMEELGANYTFVVRAFTQPLRPTCTTSLVYGLRHQAAFGCCLALQAMDFPTMVQTTAFLTTNGTFDADGRVDMVLGFGLMMSYVNNFFGWQLGTNIAATHVRHVTRVGCRRICAGGVRVAPQRRAATADSWVLALLQTLYNTEVSGLVLKSKTPPSMWRFLEPFSYQARLLAHSERSFSWNGRAECISVCRQV
jgi:hypothetical protein